VERYLETRIFQPLGMSDTHTFFSADVDWAGRVSSTYQLGGDGWERYWDNSMQQEAPFFRASGGVHTTPIDYARFLSLWMARGQAADGQLLSEETVVEALQPGLEPSYGYHWEVLAPASSPGELPAFGHRGSDGTIAVAIPEEDLLVLYFTQSRGTPTREEFLTLLQ
jgi:CubicO group peptidase (beta-lactamase class C family)